MILRLMAAVQGLPSPSETVYIPESNSTTASYGHLDSLASKSEGLLTHKPFEVALFQRTLDNLGPELTAIQAGVSSVEAIEFLTRKGFSAAPESAEAGDQIWLVAGAGFCVMVLVAVVAAVIFKRKIKLYSICVRFLFQEILTERPTTNV